METVNLKTKTACFIDNGLFTEVAIKLSQSFGKVLYWVPNFSAFPKSNLSLVGDGLEEITRIKNLWDHLEDIDIFVFGDVYFGDLQVYLRSIGKRVWGSGKGEDLELYRWETKQLLKSIGLPVQPVKLIVGMDALREWLKKHDDQYVKLSYFRGDTETFHAETYDLIEPKLDQLEHSLGAKKTVVEFIVESAINDCVEVGYDGWCIDGGFPPVGILGYEIKDAGLIGVIKDYDELPEPVLKVNKALAGYMKANTYRGFFSTEIRFGEDGKPYLTDPCCRLPSPPSELYQEMYANYGEIIWHGAAGEIVTPEPTCKYGVEAMIHCPFADKDWAAIHFPEEIRRWVKLRNLTKIDGKYYVVPQNVGLPEIGAVIGIGDTLLEAINHCKANAAQVKGYQLEIKLDSIGDALKVIEEGEAHGIHFSDDPLPTLEELEEA